MLSALRTTLYVQISPERLSVRNVKTGASISEVPEVAILHQGSANARVLAVGSAAQAALSVPAVSVVNPFGHPRSLVSDFTVGEVLLKVFFGRILGRRWLAPAPAVVLHPLGRPEGGFTQIEIRALREMAFGAGGAPVLLWQGRALTDREILSRQFPADGGAIAA